jgi:hypothetical protein
MHYDLFICKFLTPEREGGKEGGKGEMERGREGERKEGKEGGREGGLVL